MHLVLVRKMLGIFLYTCFVPGLLVGGFCQAAPPPAPESQTQTSAPPPSASQPQPSDQNPAPQNQNPAQPPDQNSAPLQGGQSATQPPSPPSSQTSLAPPEPGSDAPYEKKNGRIFGVIPNYRTVEDEAKEPTKLSPKEKFVLGLKDSFDPYAYPAAGIFAGIAMWQKQTPSFGQGAAGFGRYYGTAFADQTIGNMMSESVFPTMLQQDPRYFPLGAKHSFWKRVGYSLSREWITRGDSGAKQFNYSELAGNATAVAISNVYYPAENRNVSDNASKFGQQIGLDAFFNVLKEFWPDIRHKMFGK